MTITEVTLSELCSRKNSKKSERKTNLNIAFPGTNQSQLLVSRLVLQEIKMKVKRKIKYDELALLY